MIDNKLGIENSAELARAEERISKKKAVELFENGILDSLSPGKFSTLRFREGNGRSMRLWLDHILKNEIGFVVDWSKADKEDYLLAMERSPVKDIEIKHLLRAALTDDVGSREIYMEGIDHSYFYEGYSTFKTGEL